MFIVSNDSVIFDINLVVNQSEGQINGNESLQRT